MSECIGFRVVIYRMSPTLALFYESIKRIDGDKNRLYENKGRYKYTLWHHYLPTYHQM